MKKLILLTGILIIFGIFSYGVFSEETRQMIYTQPYLLSLHPKSEMNICWLTGETARESYVEYGQAESLGEKVPAREFKINGLRKSATLAGYNEEPGKNPSLDVFQEIAVLNDLTPGTKYFYRVVTKSGEKILKGRTYYFKTAPLHGNQVEYALLSDFRKKSEMLETGKQTGRQKIDFIVYNTDMPDMPWKAGEWFQVKDCFISREEAGREWFTVMQQPGESAKLLQYVPIYSDSVNQEPEDQRFVKDKGMDTDKSKLDASIYMQLFRPLYSSCT